jgi:hypothetical protein
MGALGPPVLLSMLLLPPLPVNPEFPFPDWVVPEVIVLKSGLVALARNLL